jgi:hypothetical protein
MSADAFDDWMWADAYFREWASINLPCGGPEAVTRIWQEIGRGRMWALLCKEEASFFGKEIHFSIDRPPEDWSEDFAEMERMYAEHPEWFTDVEEDLEIEREN